MSFPEIRLRIVLENPQEISPEIPSEIPPEILPEIPAEIPSGILQNFLGIFKIIHQGSLQKLT